MEVNTLKQNELNRAVARSTGETVSTIKRRGFSQEEFGNPDDIADSAEWEARCIDWDAQQELFAGERCCCDPA